MKKITNDTEFTEMFLKKLSARLSGRGECRKIEYQVIISDNNQTTMLPKEYMVFPNRYSKHTGTRLSVISYILGDESISASSYNLVPGTYIYKLSVNKKQRRWQRV